MNTGNVGIGTASPSAKLHVDGDAIVTGKITAQEFHTEFVSASITFESGSTKFGDTNDDLHQFTGSMRIQKSDDVNLKLMRGSQNVAYLGDLGSQNDGGLILYDESGNQDILIRTKDATNNFINTTGNFGFGTTVPGNKVHIQETNTDDYSAGGDNYANAILRLHNADTSATTPHALIHFRLDKNGGDGYLGFTTDGSTGNVEHFVLGNQTDNEILRVASGGNVGIGTTSPGNKLDVVSTGDTVIATKSTTNSSGNDAIFLANVAGSSGGDPMMRFNIDNVGAWSIGVDNSDSDKFKISGLSSVLGTNDRLVIDTSGNVGIGNLIVLMKLYISHQQPHLLRQ